MLLATTLVVSSDGRGTSISGEGNDYTVREVRAVDDGIFSELLLSRD